MSVCKCNAGAGNTGFDCTSLASVTALSFLMNKTKKDGTPNGIDFATDAVNGVIPASVIEAKINDPEPHDRWYPIGLFENVEDVRAEQVAQTFNSGNSVKIKDGIRTFTGSLIKMSPSYVETLESFGCQKDLGVMHVDLDGNLIGESLDGNFLKPIAIDSNSLSILLVKASDTETTYITVSYGYAQTVKDGNLSMITAAGFDIDLSTVRGLLDGTITVSSTTETQLSLVASVAYGNVINDGLKVEDLIATDFEVVNVTQAGATVTVDSVDLALASDGVYVLNYSSGVTAGDSLRTSITKSGYQFAPVTSTAS